MGCNESKERLPQQTHTGASDPSGNDGAAPHKLSDNASNAAVMASPGSADEGDVLARQTSSALPCAATPVRSHGSSPCRDVPSPYRHDVAKRNINLKGHVTDDREGGTAGGRATDTASLASHEVRVVDLDAAALTSSTTPPHSTGRTDSLNVAHTDRRHSPQSPVSCLSNTPTRTSPHPAVAPASPVPKRGPPLLLLLTPPSLSLSTSDESVSVTVAGGASPHFGAADVAVDGSLRPRERSGLADRDRSGNRGNGGELAGGEMGGTAAATTGAAATATLMDSASFLRTFPSTQPPSAHVSRSPSTQPARTGFVLVPTSPSDPAAAASLSSSAMQRQLLRTQSPIRSPIDVCAEPIDVRSPATSSASPRLPTTAAAGSSPRCHGQPVVALLITTSIDYDTTADGCSSTPTQPLFAGSEHNGDGKEGTLPYRGSVTQRRSASNSTASPHPRTPVSLVSPTRPRNSTVTALSSAAVAADCNDAPYDLPLPDGEGCCATLPPSSGGNSATTRGSSTGKAAAAAANNTGGGVSVGRVSSPRWLHRSPSLRSPAAPSMTLTDRESFRSSHVNAVSPNATPALTSPFTTHLQNHNNLPHSLGLANGSGNWWLSGSGMENSGSFAGTPPTNSELVRQINKPTTHIKSILRKGPSSSAIAATTHPGGATITTDGDAATTTTTLGASGVHSRVLSPSLTHLNGSAYSPQVVMHDGVSSLPEMALRTDFITTRPSSSDVDVASLPTAHLPVPSPPPPLPAGHIHPHSTTSSNGAPPRHSGEIALDASIGNGTNAGVAAAEGMAEDGHHHHPNNDQHNHPHSTPASAEKGRHGRGGGVGGRLSPLSRPASLSLWLTPCSSPLPQQDRRGQSGSPHSTSLKTTSVTPAGFAEANAAAAPLLNGSLRAASECAAAGGGLTSDEPPPDIVLVAQPKRVHLAV